MLQGGITEGDSRYLAKEILNDDSNGVPDLRKADIFSLGIMLFEIMEKFKLPNNGPIWHKLRDCPLEWTDQSSQYSDELKRIVQWMVWKDPEHRPSSNDLLERYFISPEQQEINRLKARIAELEGQL